MSTESAPLTGQTPSETAECQHCGNPVPFGLADFCCSGCETVYTLLYRKGLDRYYALADTPGLTPQEDPTHYEFLEDPALNDRLHDFQIADRAGITLSIPSIHCAACVWLLENLYQIHDGIGLSEVNLNKRQVRIQYNNKTLTLPELARFLDGLGYPPVFTLIDTDQTNEPSQTRPLLIRLGVAGFCFGNIMLFTFPFYLGLTPAASPQAWSFSLLSLALSIPVLLYSADVYWKAAIRDLKARRLGIDVPITLGLIALLGASLADVFLYQKEGFFDSLAGLVFLLLCGRVFQQKTFERMVFDRDYRSYFPISATRIVNDAEESCALDALNPGDTIRVRHGELIPADGTLSATNTTIDYSFITGEAEPVDAHQGDTLHAGGRINGAPATLTLTRSVSQSYLTSLWNQNADGPDEQRSITDRLSPWFTATILVIATVAAAVWVSLNPAQAPFVFAAVLIVACPCALALSAPFVHGQALRLLGTHGIYLRNGNVLERLSAIRAILFDKTGTLTAGYDTDFVTPEPVDADSMNVIRNAASLSTHPLCRALVTADLTTLEFDTWTETPSQGIHATYNTTSIRLGKTAWLNEHNITTPTLSHTGSTIAVAINNHYVGTFVINPHFRTNLSTLLNTLRKGFSLALVSGDRQESAAQLEPYADHFSQIHMATPPHRKAELVEQQQNLGKPVMMIGDGLNDSAALRSSDVGVVVSDDTANFCPASDIIVKAESLPQLPALFTFAKRSSNLTRTCIALSLAYNVVGISIAVSGHLSPLVAAILMPLSSITIISTALLGTRFLARTVNLEARS